MAGSLRMFVATLLPLLVCFTTHSDHTTHYVKPTANTPCSEDPCLTLSEYAKQSRHYLTSNTTLVFLPGDHVLSVNFTVENVNHVEIYAQPTLTADNHTASGNRIVCQGLAGFTFRNISHMKVHGLTFNSCGKGAVGHRYDNYTGHDYLTAYGVLVYLGQYINILNCLFQDSIGTALGVFYSSLVLKGSNSFTNNCKGCSDINDTCFCVGGGIHIYTSTLNFEADNSTFTNNSAKDGGGIYALQSTLKFTGNTTFINNSAEMCGGGIWASDSSFKFTGNSTFQSNTAAEEDGGGICASYSYLKFIGNTTFTNNSGKRDGGGIDAWTSMLNFSGNSTFTSNSAENIGGGIEAAYSTLNFIGNSTFTNNSGKQCGGGINAWTCTLNFSNAIFTSNSAESLGGGIGAQYSTLNFSGNAIFTSNSVENVGGGIGAQYSTLNFSGNVIFTSNSAESLGGGIGAQYSTLNFSGNVIFTSNSAESLGGGIGAQYSTLNFSGNPIFTSNSAESFGGGVGAQYSTLNFSGNPIFISNSVEKYYGGGIEAEYSTLNFIGNSTFANNSGKQYGGGICAGTSTLNFSGNTTFTSNSGKQYGGGIYAGTSTLKFSGNTTFTNNSAESLGGGIGARYSTLNFSGNPIFMSNSVEKYYGGGIGAEHSALNFIANSTFTNNSGKQYGGGIYAYTSTLNFSGNTTFTNNSAKKYNGGGIGAWYSTLKFSGNATFTNNSAEKYGGGIGAWYSTLKFMITGNTYFSSNIAVQSGGGIGAHSSTLNFNGDTAFRSNSAGQDGGGIRIRYSTFNFNGDTAFRNNSAERVGGGIGASGSTLNFTGNTTFKQNSASDAGGISIWNSTLNFIGNTTYRNNSAKQKGGGICTVYSTLNFTGITTFRGNQAIIGGGIYTRICILTISGDNSTGRDSGGYTSFTLVFLGNSALIHGGAVNTKDSILIFEGRNTFSGNSARYYGGGMYSENSTLKFSGNTSFSSNSGQLQGGGIYGHAARIYFSGNNSFTANTAARGGGEYLIDSFNFLFPNTVVTMDSNNATDYGGAVYVEDSNSFSYCFPLTYRFVGCFFQVYGTIEPQDAFLPSTEALTAALRASLSIYIYFYNNHAGMSGSAIYGGSIDNCVIQLEFEYNSKNRIQTLHSTVIDVLNMEIQHKPNSISSDPLQVCMCEDGIANCSTLEIIRQVYPGEVLHFPVVATGQRGGVVPAVVRAFFAETDGNTSLAQFQDTQNVKTDCTDLYYQMRSSVVNKTAMLVLYADGPCTTNGKLLNILLHFLPCPPGFSLTSSKMICGCEPRLQQYTTRCNITERTLAREGEFWVGYDNHSQVLILHPHCPFDYCKPGRDRVSFSLNNSDLQCETGRSGLLCGECKLGLSLALGSSKCIQCSNVHLLLFFPFFLAGIALVLLLLICKLTVAAGTINGLIFYANIVTVNRAIFFPPNQTNILTVFIAWLNLDLGIEACFFDGMDAYIKTWLQFIFPLYIWSLVGLIIIASYYSSRIGRLFGSNPVSVLATLFLLSYAKLLCTIIASLLFTFVNYPNDVQVAVWLYDGNVQYLHGKHIVLFLVALLTLLILFLPYTLLLTVGQWLQSKSNQRCFHWINHHRIKPFMDAYHAPYGDQHLYWTGLLLCLRCVLLLVFTFNTQSDPSLNLLVIGTAVIGLLTLTHFTGLLYKKLYLDILELSFILNLGILAVATYYVNQALVPVSQAAVAYTSVGIAFATFVGVLLYHTYQQVWPELQHKISQLRHSAVREMSRDNSSEDEADVYHEVQTLTAPTMTVIEFPNPEPHDLNDNTSMKAQPLSIASSSNLQDPLGLINPDNSKSQPLILPTMNFTEL